MSDTAESVSNRNERGRFGPGNCANPGGRPKAVKTLAIQIREFLASKHPKAKEIATATGRKIKTRLDVLLLRLEKYDPKTLMAYGFGKPIETHEMTGPDGQPLNTQREIVILWGNAPATADRPPAEPAPDAVAGGESSRAI